MDTFEHLRLVLDTELKADDGDDSAVCVGRNALSGRSHQRSLSGGMRRGLWGGGEGGGEGGG